jgi:hypothetical protein
MLILFYRNNQKMTRKHSEKYAKECDDKIERILAGPGNPAEKLSKFRHNAIEGIFSKITAYMGILASVLGLGLFVPTIGLLLSLISLIPTLMWYILIARRLIRLS